MVYSAVVDHEIVGKAVRISKNVGYGFQSGDVVGAQADPRVECELCLKGGVGD